MHVLRIGLQFISVQSPTLTGCNYCIFCTYCTVLERNLVYKNYNSLIFLFSQQNNNIIYIFCVFLMQPNLLAGIESNFICLIFF